jgi:hypothetical protein
MASTRKAGGARSPRRGTAGGQAHLVGEFLPPSTTVREGAGHLGNDVLVKGATQRHVEHLEAAANAENRYAEGHRGPSQRELSLVSVAVGDTAIGAAFVAVERGLHVGTAAQQKAVVTAKPVRRRFRHEGGRTERRLSTGGAQPVKVGIAATHRPLVPSHEPAVRDGQESSAGSR